MSRSAQITRVRTNEPIEVFFSEKDLPKVLNTETLPGDHVVLEAGDYRGLPVNIPNGVFVTATNGALVDCNKVNASDVQKQFVDLNRVGGCGLDVNELAELLDDHVNNFTNPHQVTADQVGKDIAQWNADRLKGVPITNSPPSDGYVITYDSNSGELVYTPGGNFQSDPDTLLSNSSTDSLPEGSSNLYYTDERAQDAVAGMLSGGIGLTTQYQDSLDLYNLNVTLSPFSTDDLSEGSGNLYFAESRVEQFLKENPSVLNENTTLLAGGTLDEVSAVEIRDHIDDIQRHVDPIIPSGVDPTRKFWFIDEDNDLFYGDGKVKGFFDGDVVIEGDIRLTGTILELSSTIYKRNVETLGSGTLEKVLQLNPVEYEWKHNGEKDLGLIAEEVEKIFPDFVKTFGPKDKRVNYSKMVSVLIQSIKELHDELTRLKNGF